MSKTVDDSVAVVIPNWNGADTLAVCLDSLIKQCLKSTIIVVDNGSSDNSLEILDQYEVLVVKNSQNLGFAGGVNSGIRKAISLRCKYVALLNNDATAHPNWLRDLVMCLDANPSSGIATGKMMNSKGTSLDSTGELYSYWGLPYPRGRGELELSRYDQEKEIFGASGGASLYRVSMLEEIGLFDEDFFAYYEDVDISFRAQLAGWKVTYEPKAVVYHEIGATSGKIKGFATYQTMKNQPLLLVKNVPQKYFWKVFWRFALAHTLFFLRATIRGQGWAALKGDWQGTKLLKKASKQRKIIQKNKKVSDEYIWEMMVHDLPPNAKSLRKLRRVVSLGRIK